MTKDIIISGSCACGKVGYQINGDLRPVIACHCHTCRKTMGHFMAATAVNLENIDITGVEHITWYRSSQYAKRGFCRHCGSSLFWQHDGSNQISISAGSLDEPVELEFWGHIFVAEKGNYYQIGKDERQCEGDMDSPLQAPD